MVRRTTEQKAKDKEERANRLENTTIKGTDKFGNISRSGVQKATGGQNGSDLSGAKNLSGQGGKGDQVGVFRNESGRTSGVELPDGRVFFGLSPDEVADISARESGRLATPQGAFEISDRVSQANIAQREKQFLGSVETATERLAPTEVERAEAERIANLLRQDPSGRGLRGGGFGENIKNDPERVAEIERLKGQFGIDLNDVDFQDEQTVKNLLNLGRVAGLINKEKEKTLSKTEALVTNASKLFGDVDLFGLSSDAIADFMTNREDLDELKSTLGIMGETYSGIRGIVDANGIRPEEGIALLNKQEDNLVLLDIKIMQAAALSPSVKVSGEFGNVMAELDKTRFELVEAKADIINKAVEDDPSLDLPSVRRILSSLE